LGYQLFGWIDADFPETSDISVRRKTLFVPVLFEANCCVAPFILNYLTDDVLVM
jgi:hypothetical protein